MRYSVVRLPAKGARLPLSERGEVVVTANVWQDEAERALERQVRWWRHNGCRGKLHPLGHSKERFSEPHRPGYTARFDWARRGYVLYHHDEVLFEVRLEPVAPARGDVQPGRAVPTPGRAR